MAKVMMTLNDVVMMITTVRKSIMRIMKHHMDGVGSVSNDGGDDAAAVADDRDFDYDDVNDLHMPMLSELEQ